MDDILNCIFQMEKLRYPVFLIVFAHPRIIAFEMIGPVSSAFQLHAAERNCQWMSW